MADHQEHELSNPWQFTEQRIKEDIDSLNNLKEGEEDIKPFSEKDFSDSKPPRILEYQSLEPEEEFDILGIGNKDFEGKQVLQVGPGISKLTGAILIEEPFVSVLIPRNN